MNNFKTISECKDGEWVYYEHGDLFQVLVRDYNGTKIVDLENGHVIISPGNKSIVYPLTINNKIIADNIHNFYDQLSANKCYGSRVDKWLNDMWFKLVTLPDDSETRDYSKIYIDIQEEISRLLNIRKQIDELEKNF